MCLFPRKNYSFDSIAYKKGITEFECGYCPECLHRRSKVWALRACAEVAKNPVGCMLTLTYDQFIRDSKTGKIIGERVDTRALSIRDCQLFFKRLRKYVYSSLRLKKRVKKYELPKEREKITTYLKNISFKMSRNEKKYYRRDKLLALINEIDTYNSYVDDYNSKIKYPKLKMICAGERGKRTDRAHYHVLLFGFDFRHDRYFFRRSKRGNVIYRSNTLDKIWKNGICSIDCVNINGKVARYCTKYAAKERSDETFMLFSQGIGDDYLLENFNGLNYFFDGVEYSIPRIIWNKWLTNHYQNNYVFNLRNATYKYKSLKQFQDFTAKRDLKNNMFLSFLFSFSVSYNIPYQPTANELFFYRLKQNQTFRNFRDCNSTYKKYVAYWKKRAEEFKEKLSDVKIRINQLDDKKYHSYKQFALDCLNNLSQFGDNGGIIPNKPLTKSSKVLFFIARNLRFCSGVHKLAVSLLVNKRQVTPKIKKLSDRGYFNFGGVDWTPFDTYSFDKNLQKFKQNPLLS